VLAAKEGSIANLFSKSELKSKIFYESEINGNQIQIWHLPNSVPYWFRHIEKVKVGYSQIKLDGSSWINSFPKLRTLIFYSEWVIDPPSFDPIAESTIEHVEIDLYHAGATLSKKAIQELAKLRNLKELTLRSPCRRDIEAVASLNLQVLRLDSDLNEGYTASDLHVLRWTPFFGQLCV
jgi:hypothetical protein